ncbi:MAG: hypothetical protein MUF00_12625 [Gemmatimonadaceae bacterium]|jgi:hypothetical protein|nr:hypothetical protein [Gemmatimonadaceae bacterium]
MRTTVDLDDSLLRRLRALAQREGVPFRTVLHRVLHRGLQDEQRKPYRHRLLPGHPLGLRTDLSGGELNKLAAELEDEGILTAMRRFDAHARADR